MKILKGLVSFFVLFSIILIIGKFFGEDKTFDEAANKQYTTEFITDGEDKTFDEAANKQFTTEFITNREDKTFDKVANKQFTTEFITDLNEVFDELGYPDTFRAESSGNTFIYLYISPEFETNNIQELADYLHRMKLLEFGYFIGKNGYDLASSEPPYLILKSEDGSILAEETTDRITMEVYN